MSAMPPGWYPDPPDGPRLRWWNGNAWTELRSAAPASTAIAQPPLPDGTSPYTLWIWLLSFLPLAGFAASIPEFLAVAPFLVEQRRMEQQIVSSRGTIVQLPDLGPLVAMMALSLLLTSVLIALTASSAYLDRRALVSRGVVQPFHWAWGCLGSVYIVGRAVVVHRRLGRGYAPMWLAIGAYVVAMSGESILMSGLLGPVMSFMVPFPG